MSLGKDMLVGKGVLITGAGGAIGHAVAGAFANAGARVALLDLESAALERTLSSLSGTGHFALSQDLRDVSSYSTIIKKVREEFGRLDVLINAAGVLIRRHDLDEVTEQDWDVQQSVNLKAAFFLSREAARVMRDRGEGGRIINFSSQAWWTGGFSASVVYAAAKGGVVSLTRGLARSYARHGITVNAVAPGLVDTGMTRSGMTDEQLAALVAQIPLGQMALPSDIVGAVLFLASDESRYITGSVINVSGGWLMY